MVLSELSVKTFKIQTVKKFLLKIKLLLELKHIFLSTLDIK